MYAQIEMINRAATNLTIAMLKSEEIRARPAPRDAAGWLAAMRDLSDAEEEIRDRLEELRRLTEPELTMVEARRQTLTEQHLERD